MKKIIALLLVFVMVAALFVGCKKDDKKNGAPKIDKSNMSVAMITDYGDITDESFNQATYEGAKEWCEANKIDTPTSSPPATPPKPVSLPLRRPSTKATTSS